MKIIKLNVLGEEIEFNCESRWTRSGFAHDARMWVGYNFWGGAHAYYLNRTWESWEYQTVCLNLCSNLIESRTEDLKRIFKDEKGLSRLSGKKNKDAFDTIVENDGEIKLLREIRKNLKEHSY